MELTNDWQYLDTSNVSCKQGRINPTTGSIEYRIEHQMYDTGICSDCARNDYSSADGSRWCPTCGGYAHSIPKGEIPTVSRCRRCNYETY